MFVEQRSELACANQHSNNAAEFSELKLWQQNYVTITSLTEFGQLYKLTLKS